MNGIHGSASDPYQTYLTACSSFGATYETQSWLVYAELEAGDRDLYPFVEIARLSCGDFNRLKDFRSLAFHGDGTLYVRALVDGKEVKRGHVVMGDHPRQTKVFRLPAGSQGSILSVQVGGLGRWTHFDLDYDFVRS